MSGESLYARMLRAYSCVTSVLSGGRRSSPSANAASSASPSRSRCTLSNRCAIVLTAPRPLRGADAGGSRVAASAAAPAGSSCGAELGRTFIDKLRILRCALAPRRETAPFRRALMLRTAPLDLLPIDVDRHERCPALPAQYAATSTALGALDVRVGARSAARAPAPARSSPRAAPPQPRLRRAATQQLAQRRFRDRTLAVAAAALAAVEFRCVAPLALRRMTTST